MLENTKNDRFSIGVSDIIDETDLSLKSAVTKFKKNYVKTILEKANNNQTKAAEMLGVQRTYLSRLLVELEIKK